MTDRASQNRRVLNALRRGPVVPSMFFPPTTDGGPAVAVAVEVEAAEVVAAAADFQYGSTPYWKLRDAIYAKVRPVVEAKVREVYGPLGDELLASGLRLFDAMLPAEPLQPAAIKDADVLFAPVAA